MAKIVIDAELCKHCGRCVQVCPEVLFFQPEKGTVPEVRYGECLACGHCVVLCPSEAICHEDFLPGSIHPVHPEMQPSAEQVLELLRTRRSVREFRNQPVSKEAIAKILEGARFAPSAHNSESTQFVVVQDRATIAQIVQLTVDYLRKLIQQLRNPITRRILRWMAGKELEGAIANLHNLAKVVATYDNGTDTVLYQTPTLILFHADRKVGFAGVNANLAVQNAALMVEVLGLGCFYTGFVVAVCDRDNRIAKLVNLPEDHKIYGGLAVGYPKFNYRNWIERKPARIQWVEAAEKTS
ncbi:MAG TPA: nitroreductase [Cyanobacteria bacterium UBA8803]|nr:nitroreductase [Cyanobacteria bacterium UBA9273]HBL62602.1 nitroreductase [Cyanobacteria bacterium UBA8803]